MMRAARFLSVFIFLSTPVLAHGGDGLQMGDRRISKWPAVGYVFSCQREFPATGSVWHEGPWVTGNLWYPSEKPRVQGAVNWPEASISQRIDGGVRIISTNGLPQHTTGVFPVDQKDPARQYDASPGNIKFQGDLLMMPLNPQVAMPSACLPAGMIGIALSGGAIFSALGPEGRDAEAHEIRDSCNGHPDARGRYHYHGPSPCMSDGGGGHSALVGYAFDGFGIFGLRGENGREMKNNDLDACHGHTHDIMWDGRRQSMYHYHLTREFPYTLGCFKGSPAMQRTRQGGW